MGKNFGTDNFSHQTFFSHKLSTADRPMLMSVGEAKEFHEKQLVSRVRQSREMVRRISRRASLVFEAPLAGP